MVVATEQWLPRVVLGNEFRTRVRAVLLQLVLDRAPTPGV